MVEFGFVQTVSFANTESLDDTIDMKSGLMILASMEINQRYMARGMKVIDKTGTITNTIIKMFTTVMRILRGNISSKYG